MSHTIATEAYMHRIVRLNVEHRQISCPQGQHVVVWMTRASATFHNRLRGGRLGIRAKLVQGKSSTDFGTTLLSRILLQRGLSTSSGITLVQLSLQGAAASTVLPAEGLGCNLSQDVDMDELR